MDTDYDAVIVGARCAGSTTARLLSEGGMKVALVDRATFPSDTVSTHAIAGHGTALLQHWGLFEPVLERGTPNPHAVSLRMGDAVIGGFPLDDSVGFFAPRRTVIDPLLIDAAVASGVDVRTGVAVDGVIVERGAARGVRIRTEAGSRDVRARLVVGADGAGSRVAQVVGASRYRVHASAVSGAYAYFADTGVDDPHLAFAHGQGALAFPTNEGQLCVAAAMPLPRRHELVGAGEAAFFAAIEAVSPVLAGAIRGGARVGRYVTFAPRDAHFTVPFGPGWALVGDAGHYKDPITGQGMADAFLSAHLLSEVVLRGQELSVFKERRDELLDEIHDVTAAIARMDWNDEEILALFLRYRAAVDATIQRVKSDLPSRARAGRA